MAYKHKLKVKYWIDKILRRYSFWYWFDNNLIYCEDTHSFVHRMFDKQNKSDWDSYHSAQHEAFKVIDEMRLEWEFWKKNGKH